MSLLSPSQYLEHIRRESQAFRDAIVDLPPDRRVPSCPEWTANELLGHLGTVQRWWATVLAVRPAAPPDEEPPVPDSFEERVAFFDEWSGKLDHALSRADPDEQAWSWSSNPWHHRVSWILRRQAHEALIHRLDAELAAGAVTAIDPALAADGVDEVLDVMFGGLPPWGSWSPLPHYVRVDITDTGESVWSRLGLFSGTSPSGAEIADEPDQHVVADPGVEPDAVVAGPAAVLDAWLWRRGDDAGIRVTGDRDLYATWRTCVDHAID